MVRPVFILLVPAFLTVAHGQAQEPGNAADRATFHQERRVERLHSDSVRNEARRDHNIFFGFGPYGSVGGDFTFNPPTKLETTGLGLCLGYRTHFRDKLGLKVESGFSIGPNVVSVIRDSLGNKPGKNEVFSLLSFNGEKGKTILVNGLASLVIGPFWRVTIDPGIGLTWGRHTVDSVRAMSDTLESGPVRSFRVPIARSFTVIDASVTQTLMFGKRDEYNVFLQEMLGFDPRSSDNTLFQLNFGVAYAFRISKG